MPVPSSISSLSQTPGSNSPSGSESPATFDDYMRTIFAFIAQLRDGKASNEVDVASASTTDIGAANSSTVRITGTTTITSFGTNYNGPRYVRFAGVLTLTHNATTLILPGGVNITTAAGDSAIVVPIGSPGSGWKVVSYIPAVGNYNAPQNGPLAGTRNKAINGAFWFNRRAYVSGAATTVGQYTLDRWKVTGTGGVTFSTTANKTTITIPSGQTIQQVIEGLNLQSGTYVLSWEGTAQGRIAAGSYGASGAVTASITGGTNTTIEFNTGTVTNVQLELGTVATPFETRLYGLELSFCQRYLPALVSDGTVSLFGSGFAGSTTSFTTYVPFQVPARVAPTSIVLSSASHVTASIAGSNFVPSAVALGSARSTTAASLGLTLGSSTTTGFGGQVYFNSTSGSILFDGCEL